MVKSEKYLRRRGLGLMFLAILVVWCISWTVVAASNSTTAGSYVGIAGMGVMVLVPCILFSLAAAAKIAWQDVMSSRGFHTADLTEVPEDILSHFRVATDIGNRGTMHTIARRNDSLGTVWFLCNSIPQGRSNRIDSAFVIAVPSRTPLIRIRTRRRFDSVAEFFSSQRIKIEKPEIDDQLTVKCIDALFARQFVSEQAMALFLALGNDELVIDDHAISLRGGSYDCYQWEASAIRFDRVLSTIPSLLDH